jgi:hypothetical protein
MYEYEFNSEQFKYFTFAQSILYMHSKKYDELIPEFLIGTTCAVQVGRHALQNPDELSPVSLRPSLNLRCHWIFSLKCIILSK